MIYCGPLARGCLFAAITYKTFAELKNCTIEKEKIKTELGEARAALVEAAAATARPPANRRMVTAIGVRPVSPVGGGAGPKGGGSQYAMEDGEDDNGRGTASGLGRGDSGGQPMEGGDDEEQEGSDDNEDGEGGEEEEDDADDNGRGKGGAGWFGWITGSAKKRRRGE